MFAIGGSRSTEPFSDISRTCPTAAALEAYYIKAIVEKDETEKAIKQAKFLNDKHAELKSSEDFLSPKGLLELKGEIMICQTMISKSASLHCEVDDLEGQAFEILTSDDFKSLEIQQQLQKEIEAAKEKIKQAAENNSKIFAIKKNPAFLSISSVDKLKDELGRVKNVFHSISSQGSMMEAGLDAILRVQTEARDELECVVCLEVPSKDIQVFSCLQHHLLCSDCAKQIHGTCPICRQNFKKVPLARNRLAEKMIQRFN